MADLQEWIHRLEEGAGARALKILAAILGFVALAIFYDLRAYKNFSTQEAMDAAQVARNVAEGKGFTTQFIRPVDLYLLQKHVGGDSHKLLNQPVPDLANPPVYPTLLAGLMKIFPFHYDIAKAQFFQTHQPEVVIAYFNQFLFFVAVFLVFKLARRLFDASVAWMSAAVFAGTELFWRFSVSGLSTMLLVVIFLAVVWCLVLIEQRDRGNPEESAAGVPPAGLTEDIPPFSRRDAGSTSKTVLLAIVAGALVGLGGMTRYSFGWLILPVLFFFGSFLTRTRASVCLATMLSFIAVMTPWLVRNYSVSGTAFGTAGYAICQETSSFSDDRFERSLDPEPGLNKLEISDFIQKLFTNTREIVKTDLPKLGGTWVSAFFLVGLLLPFRNLTLSRLRFFLLCSLALFVVVQALGKTHLTADSPEINSENLLVILAPLVFVFGVALFFTLLEQALVSAFELRYVAHGIFWVLACASFVLVFFPPGSSTVAYPPYWPPAIHRAANYMNEKELMMSDLPWAVAWYGKRPCLSLTLNSSEDFAKVSADFKPVLGLYLTPRTIDSRLISQMVKGNQSWGQFVFDCFSALNERGQMEVPTGFPLNQAPTGYLPDQLFLSDRRRW